MKANSSIVAVGLLAAAAALYSLVVQPCSKSLLSVRSRLTEESARLSSIEMDFANKSGLESRIAELEANVASNRTALISPMLNSYAMRAKSHLDVFAREAGLTYVEFLEGETRALPLPAGQVPVRRTARRSVKITAIGDYAAAVSFLLRAEKELPFMALQSFRVTPQKDDPVAQNVEMTVEWPVEGEVIK